jgi:superkiller protein 3
VHFAIDMAATKALLKSIKAAIDANDFSSANEKAADLVKQDPKNYTAFIFLGFARDKLGNVEGAEKAYEAATKLKPNDPQALKGLITLFENQGSKSLDKYHIIAVRLAEVYASLDDSTQCQNVIDKYETFTKKHGSRSQYRHALELYLPSSTLYSYLEGRIPHPSYTFLRIIESMEADEKEWTNGQIGERRTRLGAKIDQVMLDVQREAFARYPLEYLYRDIINWTNDDELRRNFEERLLKRAHDTLLVLPNEEKANKRDEVLTLANGMVIVKHPYELAWTIALEWVDAESLAEWDAGIFQDFIDFFPELGLSKVLRGWLDSDISPFPKSQDRTPEIGSDSDADTKISEADRLIIMVEGLDESQNSLLSHRIMAEMYLALGEDRSAVEVARKAQDLHTKTVRNYGVDLQNSLDSVKIALANALITFQAPRYHQDAKRLFEEILTRKPTASAALSGIGLILEEDEDYDEAVLFLDRALRREPENLKIRAELAWCRALSKDMLMTGLAELEETLRRIDEQKQVSLPIKAETLYRIGFCQWKLNDPIYPRDRKEGPYRYFMDSVKTNPSFAPAYTMLGIFFEEHSKSHRRARTAFQKAFELSTSEIDAAHRLARIFADNGEWDLAELVARRVDESGKATPAPGSKRKAYSWPFAALGVVEMNKQQYSKSIVHFQKALRIAPNDYHSWVGLGESYHNSGRYIAAERAFHHAESLEHGLSEGETWFAKYMLANVQRETGAYDQAIKGYEAVLVFRQADFGVAIALLQTLTESARANFEAGRIGEACRRAEKALETALKVSLTHTEAFNLWKAVGDACSLLASNPLYAQKMDVISLQQLLARNSPSEEMKQLDDLDGIRLSDLQRPSQNDDVVEELSNTYLFLVGGVLAAKRAILVASQDVHAQAVAWYNLGWLEHRIWVSENSDFAGSRVLILKAAMKCFKRAIELEAGNAEFWNAFGIATLNMHPTLSQHAFVRSLHLNDKSARAWTNLGAFYIFHNDHQLANEAFTRAQSADPDYAYAWLGQGLLATFVGDAHEARGLFTHAFDIAGSSSIIVKKQYTLSVFDHIAKAPLQGSDVASLIQPLFALHQLHSQAPSDAVFNHLTALFAERIGNFEDSEESLQAVCTACEADYEKSESLKTLSCFSQAKSDLARVQLARHEFVQAAESAETALDLSSENDSTGTEANILQTFRLSAHLTGGLAHYFLDNYDKAINMFQKVLDETHDEPDVVCMLAQVLWAKGGSDERSIAREQLFACVERHPDHVGAVTLLGVVALLDSDEDAIEAVEGDLQTMRLNQKLDLHDKARVNKVLAGVSAVAVEDGPDVQQAAIREATKSIMISPGQPNGWLELAALSDDPYAADMAVVNAVRNVPPSGDLDAEGLSEAYSQTGRRRDALQAVMVAPWKAGGWESLADLLTA